MMRKLSRRLRETDEMLKSILGTKVTASREMPRPVVQAVAEGPEKLVHVPSGMEFPLSAGPETTVGRKDPVTGIYPDVDLSPLDPFGPGLGWSPGLVVVAFLAAYVLNRSHAEQ